VLLSLPPDEVGVWVVPKGLFELATSDGEPERRQMLAVKERVEVGRRETKLAVGRLHH
jgi:hypothetical protein